MNPVLVDVIRGGMVESAHRGSAISVDNQGRVLYALGRPEALTYPRSALKLFQALPLMESGAAAAYELNNKEIALACASHNGEPMHVELIVHWLDQLEMDDDLLACGCAYPRLRADQYELIREGGVATRAHHNCSGKHIGMLTLAQYMEVSTQDYFDYMHPTQLAWRQRFGKLIDADVSHFLWERDGCGLPALCMSLQNLALGFAKYASAKTQKPKSRQAINSILDAITEYPEMLAGSARCCTDVIQVTGGRIIVKTGAEGVYAGLARDTGTGFALKIDDGATRGSEVALGALLRAQRLISDAEYDELSDWFQPPVTNSQGYTTGSIVPSSSWLKP